MGEVKDPTLEYLDNSILIYRKSVRNFRSGSALLLAIGAIIIIVFIILIVTEDMSKITDFIVRGGFGVFISALATLPHKEVLPRERKLEAFNYHRNLYLSAPSLHDGNREKAEAEVREFIIREMQRDI